MNNKTRLLSLDTLRGFDMFWIIGGAAFFRALAETTKWNWVQGIANQMHHVSWDGFKAFDLVFPLFMFIAGVAIPFALESKLNKKVNKTILYRKVGIRAMVLVLLGLVYNGLFDFEFLSLRFASVLGQIGVAYFIAAVIFINSRTIKATSIFLFSILFIIAILQLFVPVPLHGAGILTPEASINGYIDQLFLPGRLYGKTFDPEGIMCSVSASAIVLIGVITGLILQNKRLSSYQKTGILIVSGLALILIAEFLSIWYPIIKSAWTSTFNLLSGGISLLILALFYLIIDVWKIRKWTFFFRIIGLNSITIYMANRMINFWDTSEFLFGGIASLLGNYQKPILLTGFILLEWLLLYLLYKKKIFLRV